MSAENPISKMIADVTFPVAGQLFGPVLIPRKREAGNLDGTITITTPTDNSYNSSIFKCLASDACRVVGCEVYDSRGPVIIEKRQVFLRSDWRFDDVSVIAGALGLVKE